MKRFGGLLVDFSTAAMLGQCTTWLRRFSSTPASATPSGSSRKSLAIGYLHCLFDAVILAGSSRRSTELPGWCFAMNSSVVMTGMTLARSSMSKKSDTELTPPSPPWLSARFMGPQLIRYHGHGGGITYVRPRTMAARMTASKPMRTLLKPPRSISIVTYLSGCAGKLSVSGLVSFGRFQYEILSSTSAAVILGTGGGSSTAGGTAASGGFVAGGGSG
mmetsp:Transcript_34781/g.85598  ORF Transcript_34781/g.85598 Transcript_34781/m.85598 type:complete len:218 (+) Transcript_34781:961-1614(+)